MGNWFYLRNPFDNVTKTNFKRMLLMARDHRDKLSQYVSDPDIANLYPMLQGAFTHFEDAYSEVNVNGAYYQGNTQILETFMLELRSQKIKQWDIWIQNVYLDDTPQYLMLLPNKRNPFQTGAYELRIDAVKTLEKALANFPALNNVLTDVQTFLQQLNQARTTQQQAETLDQSLRQNLENTRVELAKQMQRIFGFLIYKHYQQPSDITRYYELRYLQSPVNTASGLSFSKYTVGANNRISLFDGQLSVNSFITCRIKGQGIVKVFSSNDNNATPPLDALIVSNAQEESFYANEVSDGTGFNWLVIVNESGNNIEIEIAKVEGETE